MSEPKKNKSWPYGILAYYIVFVTIVISACIMLGKKRFDLVSKDYYADEIAYQDRINDLGRTSALDEKPTFTVEDYQTVRLRFPAELAGEIEQGNVVLYRPSDARHDLRVDVSLDDAYAQVIVVEKPLRGLWSARLSWQMEGEGYYLEETVVLPPMQTANP